MNKTTPILSIIIPAYNSEKYIYKCLDSIITQDIKNIEILLIDDGSTDKTPKICDKYAKKYKNITVYHINNAGQANARNIGINNSTGKYIMFIDSDDYLDDKTFFKKIKKSITNNPDMIMYGYQKYWEGSKKTIPKKILNKNYKKQKDLLFYLIKENYYKGCPWDKIIKADIIKNNHIYFPTGKLSEDIDWCANLLNYLSLNNIIIINENPYIYVQHANSTSKKVKKSHIIDILDIFNHYLNKETKEITYYYFAYEYCMILGVISSNYVEKIPKSIKEKYYDYKWLLKYRSCKKVIICYNIYKAFGIKICAKILGSFVNIKRRGI